MSEAKELREKWKAKLVTNPNLTCNHPKLLKEYYLGAHTEDLICATCGKVM